MQLKIRLELNLSLVPMREGVGERDLEGGEGGKNKVLGSRDHTATDDDDDDDENHHSCLLYLHQ